MAGQYFGDNELKADVISSPSGATTLSVGSRRVTNVTDPSGAQDIATKNYVDTALGGLSSSSMSRNIAQTTHGFAVGNIIRYGSSSFVKSQANSAGNSEVEGIVTAVADANNFTYVLPGSYLSGLSGLTAGTTYFLDPTTAGTMTATEPTTNGQVSKPIFRALSTTTGQFIDYRGLVIAQGSAGQKRVTVITDAATLTPNVDTTDIATVTIAGNRTVAAPTGTPMDGQQLLFRIKQDATGSRTLTWNAIYRFAAGVPTVLTAAANKTDYVGFQYNAADTKYDAVAERQNF